MENNYIETTNLYISAFLYASGTKFVGARKENQQYFFKFEPKDQADKLIEAFFNGTALVNPKDLFSCLNELKDIIFVHRSFK